MASQVALVAKNLPANAGDARDTGSVPGLGRSPGGGHGNLHQYSCLENPVDRGDWRATVHSVEKSHTRLKRHSTRAHRHAGGGGQSCIAGCHVVIWPPGGRHAALHRDAASDRTPHLARFGVCVRVRVAQPCLTLCEPMDLSGSSVHGILQARILE